jgi:class 3 adenylate cyclase
MYEMALAAMGFLYRRLGAWFPIAFLAIELQSALFIVAGTLALFTFYYEGSTDEYLTILLIALALTELTIIATVLRSRDALRPIRDWIAGRRDPEASNRAWNAAIGLPLFLVRKDLPLPVLCSVIPICVVGIAILDLNWLTIFPLLAGALVALGYSAMLHYLAVEAGMRAVLVDINQQISPRTSLDEPALPLRWRLLVALPLINLVTGLVVAALTSDGGGSANLGVDVLIALLVSTTISLELTVLLSKSILRPIGDLERAVDTLNEGRYDVSVPVTTGDELGDLAASFNEMVEGLRERERIREAFGTYLDREVAEYILSEGYDEEGVEVEVTVLFTDVQDFTRYAADKTPAEVVAALNRLFEVIVPIIAAHGGHVDKFEGDGLLAVFGAPEAFPDHADRGVRAACGIGEAVNDRGEAGELRVGVGVNTGRVVAGSIGGAGRLNFSVIGAAVNVAARVEAATRELDDNILVTSETWKLLSSEFEAESRGKIDLKGIEEPMSLYAPKLAGQTRAEPAAADGGSPGGGLRRRLIPSRLRR